MTIVVSAFALMFLAAGLLLLWLGGSALGNRLRAVGRWVRVQGRIVEVIEEERIVTRTAGYTAGASMDRRPTGQGLQKFYFPVFEFALAGGKPRTMRSPLPSEDPATYTVGATADLRVDPTGKVEPLVDARGGVWLMPVGMLAAGAVALGAAAILALMVARNSGLAAFVAGWA